MHTRLKRMAAIAAISIGTAIISIPAIAQDSEHRGATTQRDYSNQRDYANNHPDYSTNRYYRMGNQEGYQDHGRNRQRPSHNHRFKNDDDRRAHDYGYHEGWGGRNYRDADRDHYAYRR